MHQVQIDSDKSCPYGELKHKHEFSTLILSPRLSEDIDLMKQLLSMNFPRQTQSPGVEEKYETDSKCHLSYLSSDIIVIRLMGLLFTTGHDTCFDVCFSVYFRVCTNLKIKLFLRGYRPKMLNQKQGSVLTDEMETKEDRGNSLSRKTLEMNESGKDNNNTTSYKHTVLRIFRSQEK